MKHRDPFSSFHPLTNFLYFALVLVCSMFLMHPASLLISLFSAIVYSVSLSGRGAIRFLLAWLLPTMLMAAILNPAFNHEGITILAYLPTGNPITLESILYGLAAAVMLAAVVCWFHCYSQVMTSDKFVYLFGRVIPALSLVLSMALRFVPKFQNQLHAVSEAQRCVGRDGSGSFLRRLRNGAAVLSIMVSWALENAIETAQSMRSRGYGLPGRTAFSIYRWEKRDRLLLTWLAFCGAALLACWRMGGLYWRYFPSVGGTVSALTIGGQLLYLALCLTPVLLNRWEDRTWKRSVSNS